MEVRPPPWGLQGGRTNSPCSHHLPLNAMPGGQRGKLVPTLQSPHNIIFIEENFGRTVTHLGQHHKEVFNAVIMKTSCIVLFRILKSHKELQYSKKWPSMKYPHAGKDDRSNFVKTSQEDHHI